jgi:hypothetical protein
MKSAALLAFSCLLSVFVVSCADDEDDKPIPIDKTGKPVPPKLVGRVASIPSDKRFVLIQSYGNWNVSTGTILTTRGTEDRTANLLVTGEAIGQYAAADLQAGTLEVGDGVYSREMGKPTSDTPPPAPPETKLTRPF